MAKAVARTAGEAAASANTKVASIADHRMDVNTYVAFRATSPLRSRCCSINRSR